MRGAALVIVGSDYLGAHARRAGAGRVEHLPTVVDLSRYRVATDTGAGPYTIGWIGSPLTARYLLLVREALAEVCSKRSARVTLVGAGVPTLDSVPIDARPWSEATEVAELQRFDVAERQDLGGINAGHAPDRIDPVIRIHQPGPGQ